MEIPHLSQSDVEPTARTMPNVPINNPVMQAGVALTDQFKDYAHQEQVKANSAVVMGRIAQLNQARVKLLNDPKEGLLTMQGENALNISQRGLADFDKLYSQTRQGLSPQQAMLFDQHTANERPEVELQLMRHEAEQGKQLQQTNSTAVVESDEQILSTLYRDPQAFDGKLRQMQAHVLDMLHMHGISDSSPAAHQAVFAATSTAYVNMIKQLMTENPAQAQHVYEIHQDEIEPHERDALVKSIHTLTAESKGQAAAHAMADHIRTGDMTESEMKSKLYDQLKDDSEAYDHAKTELNDLVTTAHKDRVNEAAESGGKIEAAIDAAHEKGEIISIQQIHSMPEYQKLLKTNTPESQAEFSKINAYRNQYVAERKTEMGEVRFARALEKVGQSDRNKSAREDRDNFMLDISDPEKLRALTETELKDEGRKHGLKYKDIKELENKRKSYLKDGKKFESAKDTNDFISGVLEKIPGLKVGEKNEYITKARHYLDHAEIEAKRQLTPDEKRGLIIQGMQQVAVNTTRASFAGIEYGSKGDVKRRMDVKDPAAIVIPKEYHDKFDALEKARKIKLTPERRQKLYDELLKEKE